MQKKRYKAEDVKAGQEVLWSSPWRGADGELSRHRSGVVVGFIPAKASPSVADQKGKLSVAASGRVKLGYGKHGTSLNDRVLVEVIELNKKGEPKLPVYYGPTLRSVISLKPSS